MTAAAAASLKHRLHDKHLPLCLDKVSLQHHYPFVRAHAIGSMLCTDCHALCVKASLQMMLDKLLHGVQAVYAQVQYAAAVATYALGSACSDSVDLTPNQD